MGRTPCCSAEGVKKGAWTSDEDKKLIAYIKKHGEGGWRTLPLKAGLQRCGKSCRLRWTNYLRPDIKRGDFSPEEEQKIIELHATIGNSWSAIAKQLSKRTDNEIKNYWNTYLKKRVAKMTETKREQAKTTKLSSSNDGQPNSTNPNQTNNANNGMKHSSQNAGDMVPHRTYMDPTKDRLANVMPRSASAKLLNILATRLSSSYCPDIRKYGPLIQSPSALFDGKDVFSNSDDLSSSDSQSKHAGSSSARSLLNKIAHCINKPTIYLEVVNSIMSKSDNKGANTSLGDDLFGQPWMQPAMSNSIEAAEKLALDSMAEDVPTHGVQEDQNGNEIESLTEDLDLDFLREWTIMDADDNGIGVIGGGLYEDGVPSTWIDSDNHII